MKNEECVHIVNRDRDPKNGRDKAFSCEICGKKYNADEIAASMMIGGWIR